jgi:hypothetical protein
MKRLIYFCSTAFMLFITLALSIACLHTCKNNTPEHIIFTPDTPKQAQQCADELLEYIQPDTYVWSYNLMEGEINFNVDFICKIEIYYAKDSDVYYAEYICYIRDNDVDFENFVENLLEY